MSARSKESAELIEECVNLGAKVVFRGRHYSVYAPGATRMFAIASSPSDWRANKNKRAEIRRLWPAFREYDDARKSGRATPRAPSPPA